MLYTHQRCELLTLCLVFLTTFPIYRNKLNSCTFLIPKGCPIIRRSKQLHSSCRLPQGFRWGEQKEVSNILFSVTPPTQRVGSSSPLLSASPRGTFDVGERHDPMIGVYVITEALRKGGKGWMVARWLNQQRSFHVRRMLLFITWNRLRVPSTASFCGWDESREENVIIIII